jgi:hypothetical protein
MLIELKDVIMILLSTTALSLSLFQIWDNKRKKINIYFGETVRLINDELKFLLKFTVINKGYKKIHIYDTRFYIYRRAAARNKYLQWNKKEQVYFFSTIGHIWDASVEQEKPCTIEIEATEIFKNFDKEQEKPIVGLKVTLLDLDGKSYSRRIKLNLLKKNEYKEMERNVFNYRYDFYKRDLQLRKSAKKRKKLPDSQNIDQRELN